MVTRTLLSWHPENGSVAEFARRESCARHQCGDGANEHPSQALLDLYTIRSELEGRDRGLDGLRIAMVGICVTAELLPVIQVALIVGQPAGEPGLSRGTWYAR